MLKKNLLKIFNAQPKKILVIGDLILDQYFECEVNRISPEAPVPIAKVNNIIYKLGGAANAANNLAKMGAQVSICGTVGEDNNGVLLIKLLKESNINTNLIIKLKNKKTIIKKRVISNNQQLLRIDFEDISDISLKTQKYFINKIKENSSQYDAVLFSDYNKGLITDHLSSSIISYFTNYFPKIKIFADPTPLTFYKYSNIFLIKPNKHEAEEIIGKKIENDYSNLEKICKNIVKKLKCTVLVITLGKDGIAYFYKGKMKRIPAYYTKTVDITGAGDTTISGIIFAIISLTTIDEAIQFGNVCGAIKVGKYKTNPVSKEDIIEFITLHDIK